ncbi:Inositol 2-dehydrogenase [Caulifigura coniformis]|uniref:Inositol 2-dehydrogenase n=1 Tax=Caulifigura coniformis TaxID=2527983 RepID=A0A517SIE8_9PLAN|nr:Gfo/Idh/MocA family oxidoreductase [Caulifigura coniformis]QDT55886.1 Inositol 2-dehydrogenase [Caulifigura coniformis]
MTERPVQRELVGIAIGAGHFGPIQLDSWRRVRGARIEAVCDRNLTAARSAAERFTVPRFGAAVEELVDQVRPDFIDVVTRPESHRELIEFAIDRKLHVLCQKPLAPSLEEAQTLVRRCNDAGVRLMVTEIWRWQPWYRKVRQMITAGEIGQPFHARFVSRRSDGRGHAPFQRQPYFRDMPRLLIYESVIHLIDVVRFLCGRITSVQCLHRQLNPKIAGEDFCLLTLTTAANVTVTIDAHRHGPAQQSQTSEHLVVEGEAGSLELRTDGAILLRSIDGDVRELRTEWPAEGYLGDSCRACLQHFADGLHTGEPFETAGNDNLETLAVVFAAYESAASGSRVTL